MGFRNGMSLYIVSEQANYLATFMKNSDGKMVTSMDEIAKID